MNVARIGLLLAGLPITVPGITINRFCSSGVQAVADAANQIRLGQADVMIAAGTESMSVMPQMMGNKIVDEPGHLRQGRKHRHRLRHGPDRREGGAAVEDQPRGAGCLRRRLAPEGLRGDRRRPLQGRDHALHQSASICRISQTGQVTHPRAYWSRPTKARVPDSSVESLAKLKPVFHARGSVTAGNSLADVRRRRRRDAGLREDAQGIQPDAAGPLRRLCGRRRARRRSWASARSRRFPRCWQQVGIKQDDLDWIELNEAFAAQSLAVMQRAGARSGQGQSARRRHRPRPSARRDRRHPHRHAGAWPAAHRRQVRHGDHVHRHRHGRGRDLRAALADGVCQAGARVASLTLPMSGRVEDSTVIGAYCG